MVCVFFPKTINHHQHCYWTQFTMKPTYSTIKNTKKNLEFTFTIFGVSLPVKHSSCRGRAECIVHKTALVLQSLLLISLGLCGARRFSLTSSLLCNMWILALYICSPRFVKAFMDGPSVIPQPHGHFAFHLNSFSLDLESWLNWTEDEIPQQINFLALMLVHSQENCPHSDQGDQRGREETVKIQTSFVSS